MSKENKKYCPTCEILFSIDSAEYYQSLIKERAKNAEFEKYEDLYRNKVAQVMRFSAKIDRYEKALKWYAAENEEHNHGMWDYRGVSVARQALADTKEVEGE